MRFNGFALEAFIFTALFCKMLVKGILDAATSLHVCLR